LGSSAFLTTDPSPLLPLLRERPFGLITDLDGTISPIADTPAQAAVSPACRRHLETIAARVALAAVVSGRTVEETRRMVGLEGIVYVGLHGFSLAMPPAWTEGSAAAYTALARTVLDKLRRAVALPGVVFEDKGPLIAVHYRQAADPLAARRAILDAIAGAPTARRLAIHEGKMVVELRPPVSQMHKGMVVRDLATQHGLHAILYLGDDATDLDAFRAVREATAFRGASVVVAGEETPPDVLAAADYRVEGVAGVEWLLGEVASALRA
jgi:trehalose 6-phosphate phosphatase